jgi:hypothetical protein
MSIRDIAFGQIKAALAVVVQAGQTLAEDCDVNGGSAELTQVEWRQLNAHLTDAGNACVRAINILTAPRDDAVEATQPKNGGDHADA